MNVTDRMREDWNARAREDANFYVAFARRDQDSQEFFDTGKDVVRSFKEELKRFPPTSNRRAWRALEIGCGPGRLMRPLSEIFGEIHGVDVSDEMIRRAEANLSDVPHAHPHHSSGADLAQFADESFDFVYSYAVFQHIPSRDVVMNYLREAGRVLKTGGMMRLQINGLPESARRYDTWSGVRISAVEVARFARESDLQLLALEGIETQYMWTTMMKRPAGWAEGTPDSTTRIRRVTNNYSSEPVAPVTGRYALIALWMENLPATCDLNHLEAMIGGKFALPAYIGPVQPDALQQLNLRVPSGVATGLAPIELSWNGQPLCPPGRIRVIPPPPRVPVLIDVTDGTDQLSGKTIVTGTIKVTIEDITKPETFRAWVAGQPVEDVDVFCADPLPPRYEINLRIPDGCSKGPSPLQIHVENHRLAPVTIELR
jgi:ubiquinone/menaquinone biosynthesis C-methylase UbiE